MTYSADRMPFDSLHFRPFSLLSLLLLSGAAGCGTDDPLVDPAPFTPDITITAGPFTVDPGGDLVMCSYLRADNDAEEDVTQIRTALSEAGHHLIVYAVDHPIDLPPGPCPIGGQPGWRQLLVSQSPEEARKLPEGVGYRIMPHQQFVLELHHVNTKPAAIEAKGSLELAYAPKGAVTIRADTYIIGTVNIDIPPNASWTKGTQCELPVDMTFFTMFGHQHRNGRGVSTELLKAGGEIEMLYSTDQWEAPPVVEFAGGKAALAGDRLSVNCEWDNPTGESLRYPHEMCFAIGLYWPSAGSLNCFSGGGVDACGCVFNGTFDPGSGGAEVEVAVSRMDAISGAKGDPASGDPIYCFAFRAEDWVGGAPKEGAAPYYVGEAIDVPLKTASDAAKVVLHDVTPGAYAVTCMMDTIGGGFIAGTGALVNSAAGSFTAVKGEITKASVVLDYAIP